jgi:hypothetical protein
MKISRHRAASAGAHLGHRPWQRPMCLLSAVAISASGALAGGTTGAAADTPRPWVWAPGTPGNSAFTGTSTAVSPYVTGDVIGAMQGPGSSLYVQPAREYMETIPATTLLNGIGLNYNLPPGTDDAAAIKTLADAGVRSLRIEMNWSNMLPNGSGLNAIAIKRYGAIFTACVLNGITPLILLNANSGKPQPLVEVFRHVTVAASAGATAITLDDTTGLVEGHSGLSGLTAGWPAAGSLFTTIGLGGVVNLSKPLPQDIPAGRTVTIDTLTNLPLFPVGTPQFEDTASAWSHFAQVATKFASDMGVGHFDVEIWNELTFGSQFLDINNYYSPPLTAPYGQTSFQPGGPAWELAARTTNAVHASYPGAKVIWGFSNTNFYQTAIADLPPGIDAQSYHPYKSQPLPIAGYLDHGDVLALHNGSWLPDVTVGPPESLMALDVKATELPGRMLAPWDRSVKPSGTGQFLHYITEQGSEPNIAGITDTNAAEQYKAVATLRALTFWLNKGVTKIDLFSAWDNTDDGFGLFPSEPAPSTFGQVPESTLLSPALLAVQRMVATFAGAQALTTTRPLSLTVSAFDPQVLAFAGDSTHPALWNRDLFTFLPFQVTDHRFVISTYVMSLALTHRLPDMNFSVQVAGVNGATAQASMIDPLTGAQVPVPVLARSATSVTLGVTATDSPRMLTISD